MKPVKIYKRKLNDKAIKNIIDDLSKINFEFLNEENDVENRYFFFKKIIMDIINHHAPFKYVSNKKKCNPLPWFDRDLFVARRKTDKLYSKFKKYSNLLNKQNFIDARCYYQKLLRLKKIDYFSNKTAGDF